MNRWYPYLTVTIFVLQVSCNGHRADRKEAAKDSNEARFEQKNNRVVAATLERDAAFAVDAAVAGMQAVRLGRVAAGGASEDIVRKLGDSMARQYSAAHATLTHIAAAKNISLPAAPGRAMALVWDEMRTLKGATLDKRYLKQVAATQQKDIDLFKRYISAGRDSDLLHWAIMRLPVMEQDRAYIKLVDSMARQRQRTY